MQLVGIFAHVDTMRKFALSSNLPDTVDHDCNCARVAVCGLPIRSLKMAASILNVCVMFTISIYIRCFL